MRTIDGFSVLLIVLLLWWVAVQDFGIITIIGDFVAPVIAVILYILPVWVIHRTAALQSYRRKSDMPIAFMGVVIILGYVVSQLLPYVMQHIS